MQTYLTFSYYLGLCLLMGLTACDKGPDPQAIIDRAIEVHGGERYEAVQISFRFRDRTYLGIHLNGQAQYERAWKKDSNLIRDVMSERGFFRKVNNERVPVVDSMARKYSNSINGVLYFALLPYKLNDPAVKKRYLDQVEIKGQTYHKIEVTFKEEGGGDDFEDVFVYWFEVESGVLSYLAYEFQVDGGGLRFRSAYNPRVIEGIRFVDYVNYKADPDQITVYELDHAFEEGTLTELSRIELEDIRVEYP